MAVVFQFESQVSAAGLSNQIKTELNDVFRRNLRYAISHRREVTGHEIISVKTQELRCWNLLSSLEELIKVGRYEIHSIYSIKEKHIEWFISRWIEKKLTYGTIANKLSYLKALAIWLRKPNIVKDLDSYAQLKVLPKRTGVADGDKSWTSKDIDVRDLIEKVARYDKYVGIQLALQLAYGLRRQESMMLIPSSAFMEVNGQRILLIDRGAKGNRERVVKRYLDEDADMRIFELAKLLSNQKTGSTIPAHKSLDQWINYYKSVMKKFGITKDELGITSHGLRFGVIVLSPLAVGFGVNIQAANHVVHFTRTWNPSKEDQATDRAYRIGQTKDVYVYYPVVTANEFLTFDAKLDQLLSWKRGLSNDMLNGTGDLFPSEFGDLGAPDGSSAFGDEQFLPSDLETVDPDAFEAVCALLWSKAGYQKTKRTRKSGDGGVDVVAITGREGVLIQCKSSMIEDVELGWEAVKDVVAGAAAYSAQYPGVTFSLVAVTNKRFNGTARSR